MRATEAIDVAPRVGAWIETHYTGLGAEARITKHGHKTTNETEITQPERNWSVL